MDILTRSKMYNIQYKCKKIVCVSKTHGENYNDIWYAWALVRTLISQHLVFVTPLTFLKNY